MRNRQDALALTERSDGELYARARERVMRQRDFFVHAAVYAIVNVALALYSLITVPGDLAFTLTAAGWGIGLAVHGGWAFSSRLPGHRWQERRIREELLRERQRDERAG